jgi:hypothetical protein
MVLLAAACGDDEPTACQHEVCAISDPACVERAATVVGCQLEQPVVVPPIRFVTAAELVAEWESEEEPLTPDEQRIVDDSLRVYALVGLMPEGYESSQATADQIRNFVAFYTRDEKEMVVLTDQAPTDPKRAYEVLVHELVHASQDAEWDLQALYAAHATTRDRFFGLRAVTEGEAVLFQNLADVELRELDLRKVLWAEFFAGWQEHVLELAAATDTPLLDANALFPYAFGGELVYGAWRSGRLAGVDGLFEAPPDSVRQVMGGYAAWPGLYRNEDAELDPEAIPHFPDSHYILDGAHEGVWLLNAALQRTAGGPLWDDALTSVSADFLTELRWNEADVAAVWRVRTSRPDDLSRALLDGASTRWVDAEGAGGSSTHVVARVGADVVLVAVSAGNAREVLAAIDGWQSPDEAFSEPDAGAAAQRRAGRREVRRGEIERIGLAARPRALP